MNTFVSKIFVLLFSIFLPAQIICQNIFSEKDFEYSKTFLPYDVPYVFALEDKNFVLLSEVKKNVMKLGRYDQYFFDQWEKEIEFNKDESAPQVFIKGDSLVTFCITTTHEQNEIRLSFRYFNVLSGEEYKNTNHVIKMISQNGIDPIVSFSENKSKFVIYNYLVNQNNERMMEFQIFQIGDTSPIKKYYIKPEALSPSKTKSAHLSNDGDLFLTAIQATEFKVESYFWSSKSDAVSKINNNFFFERPVDRIGKIDIIRQSTSSYFVSFTANIEDELIGFNITGFNVILKTVMFSHNQNLRKTEVDEIYKNYYVTSLDQKKKHLEIPETLENYRLVKSIVNSNNDIIVMIENLEMPVDYYKNVASYNMPWKHKSKDEKFYFGGDLLLFCFTESGETKWKKALQKTQYSQASGLGLSFISRMESDNLDLLMYESSKGGNFYIMKINTLDGSLISSLNLLPNQKFEFTKKYSCWLNRNSVILCGIAPANILKRSLMLVEF